MAIVYVGSMNIPNYVCLSTDEIASVVDLTQPGRTIYYYDTQQWKIVIADQTVVPYTPPTVSQAISPAVQASVDASTLVAGSIIDTLNNTSISYTAQNTGAQSINWIVYGGNASNLSDKVVVQSSATITAGSFASYASTAIAYRYYGVFILSTVGGQHGQITLRGIAK